MPTTYSLVGPYLKVARTATDFDLYDLRGNVKISDVAEVVTITQGQTNKKFEIPYASFDPVLSGSGAFMTLFNAQVALTVTSASWGYDTAGTLFYVKQMSDSSVVYESPIGAVTAPTGDVASFRTTAFTSTLNVIETSAAGSVPSCLEWTLVNTGGGPLTLNGVVIGASERPISKEGKTLPHLGVYVYAPAFTYDATGTTLTIIYQTYP